MFKEWNKGGFNRMISKILDSVCVFIDQKFSFYLNLYVIYQIGASVSCADLEGGSGGGGVSGPPPPGIAQREIPRGIGNEKNCYFSYLCTSTVVRQGWTPPL